MDDESLSDLAHGEKEEQSKEIKIEDLSSKIKIWKIVGIGAGIAFVGILIWTLTK